MQGQGRVSRDWDGCAGTRLEGKGGRQGQGGGLLNGCGRGYHASMMGEAGQHHPAGKGDTGALWVGANCLGTWCVVHHCQRHQGW